MKGHTPVTSRFGFFQGILPVHRKQTLKDALAGFQLAAMNIPQALGYTKIAGTPVETGFYTLLLPPLAFAVFGSSRYLVVAADSATAAILRWRTLPHGANRQYAVHGIGGDGCAVDRSCPAIGWILKLGFLADFLSQTVLVGFLAGVGFQVGIAVLSEMLGPEIQSRRTPGQFIEVVSSLSHVHVLTALISAIVVAGNFCLSLVCSEDPRPTDCRSPR